MPIPKPRVALVLTAAALLNATAAQADGDAQSAHPAEPSVSPVVAPSDNAFSLAVPLLDRAAAHPSYGPAPADTDPVAQMDQMMEMDHSAHQMHGAGQSGPAPEAEAGGAP